MKQLQTALAVFVLGLVLPGCVHFSYTGEELAPVEGPVPVYDKASKVPRSYKVLGQAVAYGDYQNVPREKIEKKLAAEAASRGADAVLITYLQVVQTGMVPTVDSEYRASQLNDSDSTYSMNELQRDFDRGYGQAFSDKPAPGAVREYRRIIRAEFLRYNGPSADENTEKK